MQSEQLPKFQIGSRRGGFVLLKVNLSVGEWACRFCADEHVIGIEESPMTRLLLRQWRKKRVSFLTEFGELFADQCRSPVELK